jgi:hypothetical protein
MPLVTTKVWLTVCAKIKNTNKKYSNAFHRWMVYCSRKGFLSLPARLILVAQYLSELLGTISSYHTVSLVFYGIKWAHDLNSLEDPTKNSL